MKQYSVIIQDIYEKESQKHLKVEALNAQLAHKQSLRSTNALREEIALIKDQKNNVVYTYKDGFADINE